MHKLVGVGLVGAAFGLLTSAVNALSSPYERVGQPLVGWGLGGLQSVLQVLSLILDSGWAWAALAMLVGRRSSGWREGALMGPVSLAVATGAYYGVDSVLLGRSLALDAVVLAFWTVAGVVLGALLGAVGAASRAAGVGGLLAALTAPAGALLQMIVMPPGWGLIVRDEAVWARAIVTVAAVAGTALLIGRFVATRRRNLQDGPVADSPVPQGR